MDKFCSGQIRVLVCTDAAGMVSPNDFIHGSVLSEVDLGL